MSEERKAKEIIKDLKKRKTLLERMTERMIPRAFERPPVAASAKLFAYFDIPDPYSPILKKPKKWKTEIGSSALILGENRREVARHAKVPDLKPKAPVQEQAPHQFRPQGVPPAQSREENKPPPPPAPPPKPSHGEFGGKKQHGLVGKLPMRPDISIPDSKQAGSKQTNTASAQPQKASHQPTRQFASPKGRGMTNRGVIPVRPTTESNANSPLIPSPDEISSRRPPVIGRGEQQDNNSGSFRMRRTKITRQEPIVRDIVASEINSNVDPKLAALSVPEPQKAEETSSLERSMKQHKAPSSMGLDDLFGFGGQDEGRMKMPKRTKKK